MMLPSPKKMGWSWLACCRVLLWVCVSCTSSDPAQNTHDTPTTMGSTTIEAKNPPGPENAAPPDDPAPAPPATTEHLFQKTDGGDRTIASQLQLQSGGEERLGAFGAISSGLELGEVVSLGVPDDGEFSSACPQGEGPSRSVMTQIRGKRGTRFHQLSFGCEDISVLTQSGSEARWTPGVGQNTGNYFEMVPPPGFALVGWRSKTCEDKIAELSGLAKKVDSWGIVDGTIWEGNRITTSSGIGQSCSEKTQICPPGFVITSALGQMENTIVGKALKSLGMECRKVLSGVKKPVLQSVSLGDPHELGLAHESPGKLCNLSCKTPDHPEGIVVGLAYDYSHGEESDAGPAFSYLERVKLICQDLSKNGFSYSSFADLRETGACGEINPSLEKEELHQGTVQIWRGYAATGVQVHHGFVIFKTIGFYIRPLDVFSSQPLSSGPQGAWEAVSSRAGRNQPSPPLVKKCPEGEAITALGFWLGFGDTRDILQGLKSFTCAKVERSLP